MNKRLPLAVGTVLQARYAIVGQLGHGGMGAVYEAKDNRTSAKVALKETYADDDFMRNAFEREAKMLANMSHEAFPRVMDYFAEGDGFYLVMELIRGKDLSELLEERNAPFETEQVLEWADQILDALEDLHSQDIVHRDIKPSNLKLTPRGRIKLLDFGIAKGAAGDMTALQSTVGSMAAATLQYAPLEQVLRADVNWLQMLCVHYSDKTLAVLDHGTDARSDIYALGATLYHLLTNTLPVNAPTRAVSIWGGLADKLRPADEINPKVSFEVSGVLQKATEIERDKRLASAAEMRRMLGEAGDSKPLPAENRARPAETEARDRFIDLAPVQSPPRPSPPPVVETPKPRPQPVPVMETPNWGGRNTRSAGQQELPEQETRLRNLSEHETRVRTAPVYTGFDVPKNRKTAIVAAAILVPVVLIVMLMIYNSSGTPAGNSGAVGSAPGQGGSTASVKGSTGIELVNIPAGCLLWVRRQVRMKNPSTR